MKFYTYMLKSHAVVRSWFRTPAKHAQAALPSLTTDVVRLCCFRVRMKLAEYK